MTTPQTKTAGPPPIRLLLLPTLQLGLLALLVFACARIVAPFVGVLLWSVILAVMLYPLHLWLMNRLGNKWSATLIGLVGVAVVLVPMIVVATSLVSTAGALISGLQNDTLVVPPPPPKLAELPLIGQKLTDAWAQLASNAPAALTKYGPSLRAPAAGLASFAGGVAGAALSFTISFGIAAVLVAYAKSATAFAVRLLQILTSSASEGVRLVTLTAATIRGVAVGVVGVATIQAALIGVGLFVIGIPGAGLITLAALFLGIVQIPAVILTIPVIIYAFATEDTVTAAIFGVWTFVAGISDNILKPLMLGRGLEVPMPVILIGVIGGMVADGLLGLFVGPVVLAVAYVLFVSWLQTHPTAAAPTPAP